MNSWGEALTTRAAEQQVDRPPRTPAAVAPIVFEEGCIVPNYGSHGLGCGRSAQSKAASPPCAPHLLPARELPVLEADGPHVIQPASGQRGRDPAAGLAVRVGLGPAGTEGSRRESDQGTTEWPRGGGFGWGLPQVPRDHHKACGTRGFRNWLRSWGRSAWCFCNQNTATSTLHNRKKEAASPALSSENTSCGPEHPWPAALTWGAQHAFSHPRGFRGARVPVPGGGPAGGFPQGPSPSPTHTPTLLRNPQLTPPPRGRRAALSPGVFPGRRLPGVAVVAREDPQLVTVHRGAVGRPGDWQPGARGGQGWGAPWAELSQTAPHSLGPSPMSPPPQGGRAHAR